MATVTIDAVNYEVYNSDSDVVDYANGSPNGSSFTAASADDRARYNIQATRRLDSENWLGEKVSSVQPLDWPRTGVNDGVTPQDILNAHMELAMLAAQGVDITTNRSAESSQLERIKAGSVELEYFRPLTAVSEYYDMIMDLIGPYLAGRVSFGSTLAYGVSRESITPTQYRYTGGTGRDYT